MDKETSVSETEHDKAVILHLETQLRNNTNLETL